MPEETNYIIVNRKINDLSFSDDITSKFPATISPHSTSTLTLPLNSLSIGPSCTPLTKVNPIMAGSLESAPDLGLGAQDRNLGEPVVEQLPETGDGPAPSPGSVFFF